MTASIDALKKRFREGQREQAIAECEALCAKHPRDLPLQKLCATMQGMVGNVERSARLLRSVHEADPADTDVLFNLGVCERELENLQAAELCFRDFAQRCPAEADGWARWAECQQRLGEYEKAIGSFSQAIRLAPGLPRLLVARGDAYQVIGRVQAAADDYRAGLKLAPADADALKKATLCLLELGQGEEALDLCREILRADPGNLAARLGLEWVASQLVPLWHVPMLNETERNGAYHDGLQAAGAANKLVFEIGTGSGLVAMMAARLGAQKVVTCEAVGVVARTAQTIVARNGLQERVTVVAKPSWAIQVGEELPVKADILVHEIFSSELLGEHVLPALEDARRRLLKDGGVVVPAAASIMIALVGGDDLGRNVHADQSFGFDLRPFNAIYPKKRPLYREDLEPLLMSEPVEAFRFDFSAASSFPAERKHIPMRATRSGRCYGVIQWIRLDMAPGIRFENHPASNRRAVSNWQHTVYGFDDPIELREGSDVPVLAAHDRARPWFSLSPDA
jgi:tetratricopeptide (TPR) repeat protein